MRVKKILIIGAVVAVVGAVVAAMLLTTASPPAQGTGEPPSTAEVIQGDVTSTRQLRGSIGYGPVTGVEAPTSGTVTALTAVGRTVERGQSLFSVDDRPVILCYGTLPLWRRLATGMTGRDVKELEDNLAALGQAGFTADSRFDGSTAAAVRRWQKSAGLPQTGAVELGQLICQPGPVRIAEHHVSLGSRATGPVLGITGTTRLVSVPIVPADRSLAKAGTAVTVQLGDGSSLPGTVGDVTTLPATTGGTPGQQADATATVTVADQQKLAASADGSVTVRFLLAKHKNVLSVPVLALIALTDGGYAVEVVDGTTTTVRPVEVGLFADGRVEIFGRDITAGLRVKVPSP